MNLYEFEGKDLFTAFGIPTPKRLGLVTAATFEKLDLTSLPSEVVVKAQVLSGKRFKAKEALVQIVAKDRLLEVLEKLFQTVRDGEKVEKILIEEKLTGKEYYLSLTYDTGARAPILLSGSGGVEVESNQAIQKVILDPTKEAQIDLSDPKLNQVASSLWQLFTSRDLIQAEINPLFKTETGDYVAADAKVIADDDAFFRQEDFKNYPPRQLIGHVPTPREIAATEIDREDYRGSAGSVYYDLEGDIAVLASGGGASVVVMDALLALGGKPANYTEYSGNPPGEKVTKLTEIVLDKDGLNGCWVVGGTANFTDIYETLNGFLEGLRQLKQRGKKVDFPIVIRRGGPRDTEAFEMLKKAQDEEGWDFHIYGSDTPMTETAEVMVELAKQYGEKKA